MLFLYMSNPCTNTKWVNNVSYLKRGKRNSYALCATTLKKDMKGKTIKQLKDMYYKIAPLYENAMMQEKKDSEPYKQLNTILNRIRILFGVAKWTHAKDLVKQKKLQIKF